MVLFHIQLIKPVNDEKICSLKIKPAVEIPHDQCVNGKGPKEVCCSSVFAPFSSQKFYTQQSIICALAYSFSGGGDILSLAASFCVKSHEQAIFSLSHRLEHWCNGFVPFTVRFSISKRAIDGRDILNAEQCVSSPFILTIHKQYSVGLGVVILQILYNSPWKKEYS